ncbi:MAG: beta-galactosidase, partial [Spirochaetales bacterium]
GAETVAVWTDRKKFYRGLPAVTVNRVGSGRVWYIGTSPDPAGVFILYRKILKEAGLEPRFLGADVERVRRRDSNGVEWELYLNHSPRSRRVNGIKLSPWGWAKQRCT